jgi:hypothetical protein
VWSLSWAGRWHRPAVTTAWEASVVALIVRGLLVISSVVTGWFVARDAPNFDFIQGMMSLVVIAVIVFVLAFWPARWTHLLNRRKQPD